MKRIGRLMGICLAALSLWSCSTTKGLKGGQYLLSRNEIEIRNDKKLPKRQEISVDDAAKYIEQSANKRFLGVPFFLWIYNWADPDKDKGFNKMFKNLGEPAVVLDSGAVYNSSVNLLAYAQLGRGFFDATIRDTVTYRKKKATVSYTLRPGLPYRIKTINYLFEDVLLEPVILSDTAGRLIKTGRIFRSEDLGDERDRITNNLRNQGFYDFSASRISYNVVKDSANRQVFLTVVVRQHTYFEDGEVKTRNNPVYRIRDVAVFPNYDPEADISALFRPAYDTVLRKNIRFIYRGGRNIRSRALLKNISIYPDSIYNESAAYATRTNLLSAPYYRAVDIRFPEVPDDTARGYTNLIRYERSGRSIFLEERYRNCVIQCTPAKLQSYDVEFEYATSETYNSLTIGLGYGNKNLFRGAELFSVRGTGSLEFMRSGVQGTSYALGLSSSLQFPRFIMPFEVDKKEHLINTKTKIEISSSIQHRPDYHRVINNASFGYSWGNRHSGQFTLKPVDVSYIKLNWIDSAFKASITNPYLLQSYESQIIAGLSASYAYRHATPSGDLLLLRTGGETAGNLLSLVSPWVSNPQTDDSGHEYYNLMGIQYSQYVRGDLNASYNIRLGPKSAFVTHFYAGAAKAYGNSTSVPFDRMLYAGGASSMRGWQVRTLGPGSSRIDTTGTRGFPNQVGNMRLELNLEYRFPIVSILRGALFSDVGNIWYTPGTSPDPDAVFHFNRFYKQLGVASGIGVRLDASFFIIRLDWGFKVYNPNKPAGDRWIRSLTMRNSALSFAIGYPF